MTKLLVPAMLLLSLMSLQCEQSGSSETIVKNSSDTETASDGDTDADTDADTDTDTDTDSDTDTDTDTDTDSDVDSDTDTDTDADTDTDTDSDTDADTDTDTDSDTDADTDTDTAVTDPKTCDAAMAHRTYVGCEFWPTINYNPVWTEFDFAVVIANGNDDEADIEVTRGGATVATASVAPGSLETIALPWISELKGPVFADAQTTGGRVKRSVRVDGGAYRLESSIPVTVWQFNPLQYQLTDYDPGCMYVLAGQDRCLSVSNDAALLLPATAMTGAYRVFGRSSDNGGDTYGSTPMAFTVTATQDDTSVDIQYAADVAAGTGITAATAGQVATFTMNAGDVLQLLGAWGASFDMPHADLSGSVVLADKPVQVISSNPITNLPDETVGYADHIEETVLPAEVLGREYIVAPPSSPDGQVTGHVVRLFGNFDNTQLTYPAGMPSGAPTSLNAGDVVEIARTAEAFQVKGTEPFAVASFQVGGQLQDPAAETTRGDPAFSMMVSPEQFRNRYTFLAPVDYLENYADIVMPTGATLTIDGKALAETPEAIGSSGWSVVRHQLGPGNNGAHFLEADAPVGLQVTGFGHATAYYYPGGLDLKIISDPPIIIIKK